MGLTTGLQRLQSCRADYRALVKGYRAAGLPGWLQGYRADCRAAGLVPGLQG